MNEIRLNIQAGALERFRTSAERLREAVSEVAGAVQCSPVVFDRLFAEIDSLTKGR